MRARPRSSPYRRLQVECFESRWALAAVWPAVPVQGPSLDPALEQPLAVVAHPTGSSNSGTRPGEIDMGLAGRGQTVVVIDSGIAYDHVALGGGFGPGRRIVSGWDFAENDADPYDDGPAGFHGTHIAGIIAARDDQHPGVAPGVDLVALRVFDDAGWTRAEWIENALRWVITHRDALPHPITTVNLSLGSTWNSDQVPDWSRLEDELAELKADQIFVAVSAGNRFQDYGIAGLSYPAASPSVVPVASVDADGSLSRFSQRSPRVLAAPGRAMISTVPDYVLGADGIRDDFAAASGTSMASAYVAGASMVVRQTLAAHGVANVTVDKIIERLQASADSVWDPVTRASYPRVNLTRALAQIEQDFPLPSGGDPASGGGTNASGRFIDVFGTAGADVFRIQAAANMVVEVNGVRHTWSLTSGQVVRVHAGDGLDRVELMAGTGDDDFSGGATAWRLRGPGYDVTGERVEELVVAGGGGRDTAMLRGGLRDEQLLVGPTSAQWQDSTARQTLTGFAYVTAVAGGGGQDQVAFPALAPGDSVRAASGALLARFARGSTYAVRGYQRRSAARADLGTDVARTAETTFSGSDARPAAAGTSGSLALVGAGDPVRAIDLLFQKLGSKRK